MTYRGHVKNGVIVLDHLADLKEGDKVSVRVLGRPAKSSSRKKALPTLYEQLKPVIGIVKGLPSDLAENHDHYLYGRPKVRK